MQLKHELFGNKTLRDSQKVYFCAAPGDFTRYFRAISMQILTCIPSLSFWYPEGGSIEGTLSEKDDADLFSSLLQMNLFVIPVTRNFLTEDCSARTREFSIAIRQHIPVLPILVEPGLETLFNETCGNLQCLSMLEQDATSIPFLAKLASFLNAVILQDEKLVKIREAFGGYIFLSYRKKDRAQAQEVMRLIHRDPSCRDAAIWYDEFLAPGEDFNDSIRQALEKSDLFTLVVTPHILEDNNYVMTQEYPMALQTGRQVMPVVAVDTKDSDLEKCYPGLPERLVCSGDSAEVIAEKVRTALRLTANEDAEHLYYIGLAYLNGVDVETNQEKALALITAAAEGGTDDAYRTLTEMYQNGNGVPRDYDMAAVWAQKYAEHLEKVPPAERSLAARQRYVEAWIDAGNKWRALKHKEKAFAAYEKAVSEGVSSTDLYTQLRQIDAYRAAYEFARTMDDPGRADRFFEKLEDLCRYVPMDANQLMQAELYRLKGRQAFSDGKWGEAVSWLRKAKDTLAELETKLAGEPTIRNMKAGVYQETGMAYLRMKGDANSRIAERYFTDALAIYDKIESGNSEGLWACRIFIYLGLAKICEARGDHEGALQYDLKGRDIALKMHAKEDSLDTARVLREMMNVCADGVRNVKGDPEAEAYYLKTAGDLSKNIARRMGTTLGLSEAGMDYVAAQAAIPYYRKRAEVMSRHGKLMKAHQYKKDLKELEKVPNPARQDERITRLCSDSQAGETGTAQDRILPGGNQDAGNGKKRTFPTEEEVRALTAAGTSGDTESLQRAYDGWCLLARRDEENERYHAERNRAEELLCRRVYEAGMAGDLTMLEKAVLMCDACLVRIGGESEYYDMWSSAVCRMAELRKNAADAAAGEPAEIRADLYLRTLEAYKAAEDETEADPEEWEKESLALAEKAAWACRECGLAGEPMKLLRAFELFRMIAEKDPGNEKCSQAAAGLEDKIAYTFYQWGKTDPRYMEASLGLYRHLLQLRPEDERLKKNVRVTEGQVRKQKMAEFMRNNSAERRNVENILSGIIGKKINLSDELRKR